MSEKIHFKKSRIGAPRKRRTKKKEKRGYAQHTMTMDQSCARWVTDTGTPEPRAHGRQRWIADAGVPIPSRTAAHEVPVSRSFEKGSLMRSPMISVRPSVTLPDLRRLSVVVFSSTESGDSPRRLQDVIATPQYRTRDAKKWLPAIPEHPESDQAFNT